VKSSETVTTVNLKASSNSTKSNTTVIVMYIAKEPVTTVRHRVSINRECLSPQIQQGLIFSATESGIVRMEQMIKDHSPRSGG